MIRPHFWKVVPKVWWKLSDIYINSDNFHLTTPLFALFSSGWFDEYRGTYTYGKHKENEYERADGSNLYVFVYEHLHTDEHQQHAHAYLQIAELVGYSSQQEEKGTQAENGEDVGEEHYVGVERHGEHSRNAVECEYQVAELYEDYGEHKRSKVEVLVEE